MFSSKTSILFETTPCIFGGVVFIYDKEKGVFRSNITTLYRIAFGVGPTSNLNIDVTAFYMASVVPICKPFRGPRLVLTNTYGLCF